MSWVVPIVVFDLYSWIRYVPCGCRNAEFRSNFYHFSGDVRNIVTVFQLIDDPIAALRWWILNE